MAVLLVLSIVGLFRDVHLLLYSDAKMFYRDNAALAAHPSNPAMADFLYYPLRVFFIERGICPTLILNYGARG